MYTPEERQIFRYHNGTKVVCADPMVLYRRFLKSVGGEQTLGDLEKHIHSGNDQLAEEATGRLLVAIQGAFNLQPLDEEGQGTTESEQLKAYFDFLQYLAESKKKAATPPTCAEPTGPEFSANSDPVTATGSASG